MLITIDLNHPDNDIELVGLAPGQTEEQRFGVRGYAAYRLFGAAARVLFLTLQRTEKSDIQAATAMQVEREASFIRQRLDELGRGGNGRNNGRRS